MYTLDGSHLMSCTNKFIFPDKRVSVRFIGEITAGWFSPSFSYVYVIYIKSIDTITLPTGLDNVVNTLNDCLTNNYPDIGYLIDKTMDYWL